MANINTVVKVVKIAGMVCSVAGTLMTTWAGGKENTQIIEKMVEKTLNKK